jgi:hypothetical protein
MQAGNPPEEINTVAAGEWEIDEQIPKKNRNA